VEQWATLPTGPRRCCWISPPCARCRRTALTCACYRQPPPYRPRPACWAPDSPRPPDIARAQFERRLRTWRIRIATRLGRAVTCTQQRQRRRSGSGAALCTKGRVVRPGYRVVQPRRGRMCSPGSGQGRAQAAGTCGSQQGQQSGGSQLRRGRVVQPRAAGGSLRKARGTVPRVESLHLIDETQSVTLTRHGVGQVVSSEPLVGRRRLHFSLREEPPRRCAPAPAPHRSCKSGRIDRFEEVCTQI
jgi:hypothetical protein